MRCFPALLAFLGLVAEALRFDDRPADAQRYEQQHLIGTHFGEDAVKASRSESSTMKLHMMRDKGLSGMGAVCLDGSDAGFYFAPATTPEAANNWAIYFAGGAWCYGEVDCWQRSETYLGSSKPWADQAALGGIMSDDCSTNPDLCNFNRVHLMYCDGFSFASDRTEPLVVSGLDGKERPLYFRGKRILEAALATLLDMGLRNAEQVLLTGCSAGGLAAFLHSEYVHSFLKDAGAPLKKYKTAPLSGFFLSHPTVEGQDIYVKEIKAALNITNSTGSLDKRCLAEMEEGEEWRCSFAKYAYAYIDTPLFPINSDKDWWQLACILTPRIQQTVNNSWKVGCGLAGGGTARRWDACVNEPEACSASQIETFNQFGTDFDQDLFHGAKTLQKNGNGAFIHSCHSHCEAQETYYWTTFAVNGVTMQQAFSKWWSDEEPRSASGHTYMDCAYNVKKPRNCNPTCRYLEREVSMHQL